MIHTQYSGEHSNLSVHTLFQVSVLRRLEKHFFRFSQAILAMDQGSEKIAWTNNKRHKKRIVIETYNRDTFSLISVYS